MSAKRPWTNGNRHETTLGEREKTRNDSRANGKRRETTRNPQHPKIRPTTTTTTTRVSQTLKWAWLADGGKMFATGHLPPLGMHHKVAVTPTRTGRIPHATPPLLTATGDTHPPTTWEGPPPPASQEWRRPRLPPSHPPYRPPARHTWSWKGQQKCSRLLQLWWI